MKNSISECIKHYREAYRMTQSELAKQIGVSQRNISYYESGDRTPPADVLKKLASIFNISVDYLLGTTSERQPSTELDEWIYPTVQNRFGTILSKYRARNNLSGKDFASQLGISEELLFDLESGKHSPSMSLIQKISKITKYNVDYIVGAQDETAVLDGKIDLCGVSCDKFISESDIFFKSRFEELCLKHGINDSNANEKLGITHSEYIDIKYNRMPTLSELLRIAYALDVSMDYLTGRTDNLITPREHNLIDVYRQLNEDNQDIIMGELKKLYKQQKYEESVAADEEPMRKVSAK